ncbi:MAG: 50S ribosomal protein L25 [Acidimicrobiia bacterium]
MDQVTLSAEPRDEAGSRPSRRLRRSGLVPGVVYGRGLDPVPVTVSSRDLFAALRTEAGLNAIFDLDVAGNKVLAVAREIQRHPVRGSITHLDFIKVSLDEAIQAEVGLEFLGVPPGVSEEGGIVETIFASVTVQALPTEIPSSIEIDISELHVGDTVSIGDLPEIEGVEYVEDPDRTLLTVLIPRIVEEEVEEVEETEGEEIEGEEVEGAEEAEATEDAAEDG